MTGENSPLRIGVPDELLSLSADGGHGRVWSRVLAELSRQHQIVPLGGGRRLTPRTLRRPPDAEVVLADGHNPLPSTRAPIVAQVHEAGWWSEELRAVLNPDFLAHIALHTERSVQAAAQVITPSQAARREVIDSCGVPPDRVHAVAHGVEPAFSPAAAGGRALVAAACCERAQMPSDVPCEAPYVLHVAMLHPRKNLGLLRQAMTILAHERLPHRLVIAGRPPVDRPDWRDLECEARAELHGAPGRVVYLGQPSDEMVAALMAGADAFCLPSLHEGFGLSALEAMACGTPTIVSDRGALPEVVGDGGLVVSPTVEGVAGGLRAVLLDPELARQLAHRGAQRAREFTWKRTAEGWVAVLRLAIERAYTRAR
ncbi:MAG: glycosyltransferase family 4 protein [Actinomycetota bacterium]|nr:glycosyltransferase family 4 protein [Actinomycetota bacterium]